MRDMCLRVGVDHATWTACAISTSEKILVVK